MSNEHPERPANEGEEYLPERPTQANPAETDQSQPVSSVVDGVIKTLSSNDKPAAEVQEASMSAPDGKELEVRVKKALIYFVDDEPAMNIVLKRGFSRLGFENLRSFNDGDEVIAAMFDKGGAIRELPDVIISDTQMMRMGGLALYEKIKAIEGLQPFFIAASGNGEFKEKWQDVPFILKPYDINEVACRVTKTLTSRFGPENRRR